MVIGPSGDRFGLICNHCDYNIGRPRSWSQIYYYEHDYTQNWTTRSPVTSH